MNSDEEQDAPTEQWHNPPPDMPDPERVQALGDHLVEIHAWIRRELAAVRADVDEFLDGQSDAPHGPTPTLGLELQRHCMTFCEAVQGHHDGEEALLFPALEEQAPDLGPLIGTLRREHEVIAGIVQQISAVLADVATAEPDRVRADLARLSSELDSHLDHEEAQLVSVLNAQPMEWTRQLLHRASQAEG